MACREGLALGLAREWLGPKSRFCGVRAGRQAHRAVPLFALPVTPARALSQPGGRRPPWRQKGRRRAAFERS